jgi:hypothetical protein
MSGGDKHARLEWDEKIQIEWKQLLLEYPELASALENTEATGTRKTDYGGILTLKLTGKPSSSPNVPRDITGTPTQSLRGKRYTTWLKTEGKNAFSPTPAVLLYCHRIAVERKTQVLSVQKIFVFKGTPEEIKQKKEEYASLLSEEIYADMYLPAGYSMIIGAIYFLLTIFIKSKLSKQPLTNNDYLFCSLFLEGGHIFFRIFFFK